LQCGSVRENRAQVERYLHHGATYATQGLATVCETGVFKGESATIWLCSHPTIRLFAFDYKVDENVGKLLRLLFPGRVVLVEGSSVHTIPQFRQSHPRVRCSISSVDGGHFGFVPLHDLFNFGMMSEPHRSLLLMDEIDYLDRSRAGVDDMGIPVRSDGKERACCPSSTIAWRYAQATGLVREQQCFRQFRGWCEGHFLRNATDTLGWRGALFSSGGGGDDGRPPRAGRRRRKQRAGRAWGGAAGDW